MLDDFEFTENLTAKEFEKQLAEYARSLEELIEAESGGFDTSDNAKEARLARQDDFLFFARTYFPHYIRDKTVGGETVPVRPAELHEWIGENFPKIVQDELSHNIAIAAPRGEAKSTYFTIFVIWCIVRKLKRYIIYIMDIYEQAAVIVQAVEVEMEINARLAHDYGEACGKGAIWQQGKMLSANGVMLHARGAKQAVRGLKNGAHRPDLVLLDDIENDENIKNPDQRDSLTNWLNSAVENLGEAGSKFDILYCGTMLHHDSTLKRTQENPLWQSKTFQAIVRQPDNLALWDTWEEVLRNEGIEAAHAFHHANKEALHAGAVVSWPDKRGLYDLMLKRIKIGHTSFDTEYQNDPVASDANFTDFTYWAQHLDRWVFFGAIDPSLGKRGRRGDPSAILVGGLDRENHNRLDVIEADICRRLPAKIITDTIAYQQDYGCMMWFVEAVQFQEFLRTQLMQTALDMGVPLPALPVIPNTDKDLRIATLQPAIAAGNIRFHARHKTMLEQLKHWPKAKHDDGPDALEMLWKGSVQFCKPSEIRTGTTNRFEHPGMAGYMR